MSANPDLNSVPYWKKNKNKKRPYRVKSHENFYMRGQMRIAGDEHELRECKECHQFLPPVAFTTKSMRSDGSHYLKKICRKCCTKIVYETNQVKKNAPPQPESGQCNCCHQKNTLHCDHVHGTRKFRGWLCKGCNVGVGELGDSLEGVLQAAIYLENDKDKIVETLHKVFNEMFTRTYKINDE